MSLTFGLNPWWLLLGLLVATGLTLWMYRDTVPALSTARRAVLMTLRGATLFLVLFLLFEPLLRRVDRDTRPPTLAVLLDDSQSLTLPTNPADSASTTFGAAVQEVMRTLNPGAAGGDVRFFAFDEAVRPVLDADSLRFQGGRTNLAQALGYVQDALDNDNLGGVVLVSDGQYNTGRNPLYLAERYDVPIYTVVIGDTSSRRDVQVRRVTTNDLAYLGDELPVQVGLRAVDFGGATVSVTLFQDGQVLDTETLTLPEGTAEVPVDLAFTPQMDGLARLTAAVTRLDGEATYRNNAESFTVRVLENRRRVLLLGAGPGPDVAALRQILSTDPNTEITARVQQRAGRYYEGPFPAQPDSFDVIVLAGFPGRVATAEDMQQITRAAEEGTPVLFLLSRSTDLGRATEYLGDVLPVGIERLRSTFVEAGPVLTPAGRQHPVLALDRIDQALLPQLPPLLYNESRWTVSPDARVLATVQVRGVALDDPLLVLRRRGDQRVAALLGAGTWRWHNLPDDLAALDAAWPGLVSNLVQWLTTPEDTRPVRVRPVTDLFGGGEAIQLTGQAYDESLNPVPDAAIEVTITAPDGAQYPYVMDAVGNGRYVLNGGVLPEGTYQYVARAELDGTLLGTDRGAFAVGPLTLEFRDPRANTALMRQIAQRSAGAAFTPATSAALPDTLLRSAAFQPEVVEEIRDIELWQRYAFLIAILVLLATEWFLRKRSGMV